MLARLIQLVAPALCVGCGLDAGRTPPLCRDCRRLLRPAPGGLRVAGVPLAWAAFAYDGPAGAMVRALKFRGVLAVADAMAAQLIARAPADLLAGALVPVPIHRAHRRVRGVNHARVLAEAIARRTQAEVVDCLVRSGAGRPQVGRGRRERMAGVTGRIQAVGAAVPARAVIVDDVITTGATLAACARALRAAGAREVAAVTFAATEAR